MLSCFRIALILCLISNSSFAQTHTIVKIHEPDILNPCEVSIAINPTNPNNLIATSLIGAKVGGPTRTNATYVTTDGGKTWKTSLTENPKGLVQGDDAIAFSSDGVAHHSFISFDGIRTQRPRRAVTGIIVTSSKDGGQTWSPPVPAIEHINSVTPFEDKPYVVTDNVTGSPHKNNVYMAWTRFDEYGSRSPDCYSHIYFTRSADAGKTFAAPFRITDSVGDCIDGDGTMEGAIAAAGMKGEVYVVWAGPKGLYFDKSLDGGWTFGADKIISQMPGGWDMQIAGLGRANGMPVTKVDNSNSAHRGTIYVNWIDERNGDPDVFLIYSRDGGATWSQPVRVNDDKVKNGKAQFLTWMVQSTLSFMTAVIWMARRQR
jgi:hypothetical protein